MTEELTPEQKATQEKQAADRKAEIDKAVNEAVEKTKQELTTAHKAETEKAVNEAIEKFKAEAPNAWRDQIQDKDVKAFADRFTSLEDLARAGLNFRQKLSNAVVKPAKDAKPEERAEFRKAWGVPETPDKYELVAGEGQEIDEGFKGLMSKTFHELDINQDQAKGLNQAWNTYLAEVRKASEKATKDALVKAEDALRKEWGKDFEANSKFARGAANAFGGEEFLAWVEQAEVDGVKVGNHPFFLKTFAQIGRRMGEDGSHFSPSAEEKASLREKIKTKREELNKAKASQDHSAVERIDKELRELYEKAYPGSR